MTYRNSKKMTVFVYAILITGCGSGGDSSPAPAAISDTGGGGGSTQTTAPKSAEEICREFDNGLISEERTQQLRPPEDLRNFPYCEVIPWFETEGAFCAEVYNSMTFNDCPDDEFLNLDQQQVTEDLNAKTVYLNGPRHWLMNEIERESVGNDAALEEKIQTFGGIQMRRAAILASESETLDGATNSPYSETTVYRNVIWRYLPNNEIYELTSPDGATYVMQTYSRKILFDQSIADLVVLGAVLDLPTGWEFRSRTLSETLELRSNGAATVIQDEYQNTYTKVME